LDERLSVDDHVWQDRSLVAAFLTGVRGGIPYAADQIEIMLRVLGGAGLPVRRFLDLGCGSGVLAQAILTQYPEAQAILLDFSEPMLDAAREQFAPDHEVVVADFGTPSWTDSVAQLAPFDAIVSGFAIHHQPDERKPALFGEIFELLTPGGWFLNVEHVASPTPLIAQLNDELFVDRLTVFHERAGTGKSRAEVASVYVYRPDKAANILAPVEDQCRWLRSIGYEEVDCFFKVFELAVFGGRHPA
jgi:tRNA (cmo5U34)-methyltransferase